MSYGAAYGAVADYFGQSGGTGSPGKAGGAGYNSDSVKGNQGDNTQLSASSGTGWISAAASMSSTDKSAFSTPFTQGFGGITNNQIISSPGATNNAATSPITAPPVGYAAPGGLFGSVDPTTLLVLGVLLVVLLMRR
jgi:hypothetical protein